MKKLVVFIIVVLIGLIFFYGWPEYSRGKLINKLKTETAEFDEELSDESHQNFSRLINKASEYMESMKKLLSTTGFMFGDYLKSEDKKIIINSSFERITRLKEIVYNNPNFYYLGDDAGVSYRKAVNKFLDDLSDVCLRKKDKELDMILQAKNNDGSIDELFMSREEMDERDEKYRDFILAQRREKAKLEYEVKKKKREMLYGNPSDQKEMKTYRQEKYKAVSRTAIKTAELNRYIGEKLQFTLKNGKVKDGTISKIMDDIIQLKIKIPGGSITDKVSRKEIAKVEQVKIETKYRTVYDETGYSPIEGFDDLILSPYPKSNEYIGFITKDYKIVFVSTKEGKLAKHSKKNKQGFTPSATKIDKEWSKHMWIENRSDGKSHRLNTMGWFKPIEGRSPRGRIGYIYIRKNGEKKDFELKFQIRLMKELSGERRFAILKQKDLVLNKRTVLLMFYANDIDRAIYDFGNPRYGKGEMPWEYVVQKKD